MGCTGPLHWVFNMCKTWTFSKHVRAAMLGSRPMGKSCRRLWNLLMCMEMGSSVVLCSCWTDPTKERLSRLVCKTSCNKWGADQRYDIEYTRQNDNSACRKGSSVVQFRNPEHPVTTMCIHGNETVRICCQLPGQTKELVVVVKFYFSERIVVDWAS